MSELLKQARYHVYRLMFEYLHYKPERLEEFFKWVQEREQWVKNIMLLDVLFVIKNGSEESMNP